MIYQRLAEIFDGAEGSYERARAVLTAMRDAGSEVLAVGIDGNRWLAAFDHLLASADAADAVRTAETLAWQNARWLTIRQQLEEFGCRIWKAAGNDNVWRIDAPDIELEVDLASGEVEGLWIGPLHDPIAELPKLVRSELEHRRLRRAEKARRNALREGHTWDRKQRAWLPNDGDGPPISGGGSTPGRQTALSSKGAVVQRFRHNRD